jgi:hypothetical protein
VNPLRFKTQRDVSVRLSSLAIAAAAACTGTLSAQTAYLDMKLTNGATTAIVAPGQGFQVNLSVRSTLPVDFNAAQLRVICTEEGMQLDQYEWSPPFVTRGKFDYSLNGAPLPLVVNDTTLQGPGYPIETADIEFATFDFFQYAEEGQLLRLWVRAPEGLAPGSHHFIAAVPDAFTNGFLPVPMTTGTTLRVEVVSSKQSNPADVDGDGAVNSTDLTNLLVTWGSPNPIGQADGDLDGDGDVDAEDLTTLLVRWTG